MATSDQTLLQRVQYTLLEPPDGGQHWPSALWSRDEMLALANQRQNKFLYDTLLLVGIANLPVAIGAHLIALPFDWLRTVSLVWRGTDGTIKELHRVDSFEADHALPTWEQTNTLSPLFYMDDDVPGSLTMRIGPAPTVAGKLELLYVPAGTDLNGNGEILVVPDELSHAVKYGVLASALAKDGRGRDPARAAYCEQRVELAKAATAIILNSGWT